MVIMLMVVVSMMSDKLPADSVNNSSQMAVI